MKHLMKVRGVRQRKELASMAGVAPGRVTEFLKAQSPRATMDFMDQLLVALGSSLVEALQGAEPPVRPLPVLRPDVQKLAETMSRMTPDRVAKIAAWVEVVRTAKALPPSPVKLGA